MKVLICGSRNWSDEIPIEDIVNSLPDGSTVIAGAARGADYMAESLTLRRKNLFLESFPADWGVYGKRAGYMRNIEMLNQNPDVVYAFPLGESRGTWHTIKEARKRGIKTFVYGEGDDE